MSISKVSGTAAIRDPDDGEVRAKVEAKINSPNAGKNGVHVIAEMDNFQQLADAIITGDPTGFTGTPVYVSNYRVASTSTQFSLSPAGTNIFTFTGKGRISSLMIAVEDKSTTIQLLIDGILRFSIDLGVFDVMGVNDKPNLGPFNVVAGGKVLNFFPRFPILFSTSFQVKGLNATSKKVYAYIVTYTEET